MQMSLCLIKSPSFDTAGQLVFNVQKNSGL